MSRIDATVGSKRNHTVIGRDLEIKTLDRAIEEVGGGAKRIFWITGAAGMGKSTFLDLAIDRCRQAGFAIHAAICSEDGNLPFQAVPHVGSGIHQHVMEDRFLLSMRFDQILASENGPYALFIDDVQWADYGTQLFLNHCLGADARQLLVILVSRPLLDASAEISTLWRNAKSRGILEVQLEALSRDETDQLAGQILRLPLKSEDLERVYEETGGHPLATVHLSQAINERTDSDEGEGGSFSRAISDTLRSEDLFEGRLRLLSESDLEAVECLSVFSKGAPVDCIAKILGTGQVNTLRAILGLVDRGFLTESDESEYRFSHGLLRRAVLDRMPRARRQTYHRAAAEFLSNEAAPNKLELALQYEGSDHPREAFYCFWELGTRLGVPYIAKEGYLERAKSQLAKSQVAKSQLEKSTGIPQRDLLSFELDWIDQCRGSGAKKALSQIDIPSSDTELRLKALGIEARLYFEEREYEDAAILFQKALKTENDPLRAHYLLGSLAACREGQGRIDEAVIVLKDAMDAIDGHSGDQANFRRLLCRVYLAFMQKRYSDVMGLFDKEVLGPANLMLHRSAAYTGQYEACRIAFREIARTTSARTQGTFVYCQSLCDLMEGDAESAGATIRAWIAQGHEPGTKYWLWCQAIHLEAEVALSRRDSVRAIFKEISSYDIPKGESRTVIGRARAMALALLGSTQEARKSFRTAVACATPSRGAEWAITVIAYLRFELDVGQQSRAKRLADESLEDVQRIQAPKLQERFLSLVDEIDRKQTEVPPKEKTAAGIVGRLLGCDSVEEAVDVACGEISALSGCKAYLINGDVSFKDQLAYVVPAIGEDYRVVLDSCPGLDDRAVSEIRATCEALGLLLTEGRTVEEEVSRVERQSTFHGLVGSSDTMEQLYSDIKLSADCDETVLIEGETGTGKELVARAVYLESDRNGRPYLTVNCAALSEEILMSELFGHCRGAFTGADKDRKGLFEAAEGGVLFLDEIGEASPSVQASLLRVLQYKRVRRVGESREREVDVRVVAATNRNLEKLAAAGGFRKDLLYRLNVMTIEVPPLRSHREDIEELASHILAGLAERSGKPVNGIDKDAVEFLKQHEWVGNVRELENWLKSRFVRTGEGGQITCPTVRSRISEDGSRSLKERVEDLENQVIREELTKVRGNVTAAARRLGMSRSGLQKKIYKYRLSKRA